MNPWSLFKCARILVLLLLASMDFIISHAPLTDRSYDDKYDNFFEQCESHHPNQQHPYYAMPHTGPLRRLPRNQSSARRPHSGGARAPTNAPGHHPSTVLMQPSQEKLIGILGKALELHQRERKTEKETHAAHHDPLHNGDSKASSSSKHSSDRTGRAEQFWEKAEGAGNFAKRAVQGVGGAARDLTKGAAEGINTVLPVLNETITHAGNTAAVAANAAANAISPFANMGMGIVGQVASDAAQFSGVGANSNGTLGIMPGFGGGGVYAGGGGLYGGGGVGVGGYPMQRY